MSTVQQIETAVSKLSRDDLAAFRQWFAEYDSRNWDLQFERDVREGRLDTLADEALREGRCIDL